VTVSDADGAGVAATALSALGSKSETIGARVRRQ
jgi:hypothetical protein